MSAPRCARTSFRTRRLPGCGNDHQAGDRPVPRRTFPPPETAPRADSQAAHRATAADPNPLPDVLDRHLVAEDEPGDPLGPRHLRPGRLVAPRLPRDLRTPEFRTIPRQRDVRR